MKKITRCVLNKLKIILYKLRFENITAAAEGQINPDLPANPTQRSTSFLSSSPT
jgi:hypothetical protein